MTVQEMRKERARLVANAGEILRAAENAGRGLTVDETTRWNKFHADADSLKKQAENGERQQSVETDLRQLANNPIKPGFARGESEFTPQSDELAAFVGVDSDGRQVRGLRKNHSYAEYLRETGQMRDEFSKLTMQNFLRALLNGPKNDLEARALAEGTSAAGGVMVPIELAAQVIDRLRAASSIFKAGAVTVPMSSKTLTIARVTGDPGVSYHTENAADLVGADATFDSVTLTAQFLGGIAKISRELVADASNCDQVVMNCFARAIAVEMDRAALIGSGVSPEPKGIKNVSGIGAVSMGVNGLALANFDPLVDSYRALLDGNSAPPTAFIMANRTLAATAKLKDSQNQPMRIPQLLQNIPFYSTSKLPINETQGSSNAASSIFAGDWSQLMVGLRSAVTIEILREAYMTNAQLGIAAFVRFDVAPTHPEAFCRIAGVL